MLITYDPDADAVQIMFSYIEPGAVTRSERLDDRRRVQYDAAGRVLGIEFLEASSGLDLFGAPERERIEQLLGSLGGVIARRTAA